LFPYDLLDLSHHTIEFIDQIGVIAMLAKRSHKRSVIPNRAIRLSAKPLEYLWTMPSKLSQYCARVMQLIGRRDQPRRRIGGFEMFDVSAFSFQPRRLWRLVCVGATINDPRDVIAKFLPDIAQSFRAAAIFHGIVKKRANRFGFIRTVLQRDSRGAKDMCDVRNPRFLPHLITMRPRGINQRFLKLHRQLHVRYSLFGLLFTGPDAFC
jgi:hypothetical protein